MIKITIDQTKPFERVMLNYGMLDAGNMKVEDIEIENISQFDFFVDRIDLGIKNVSILNPTSVIKKNSTYVYKLKIDAPLDIQEPIKGPFTFKGKWMLV